MIRNFLRRSCRSPQLPTATQLPWVRCNPLVQLQLSKLCLIKVFFCHRQAEVVSLSAWQRSDSYDSYRDRPFCNQKAEGLAQKEIYEEVSYEETMVETWVEAEERSLDLT